MVVPERDQTTASAIKRLMFDRGLRPGDPMPTEADLMEELQVSRSSVREAVRTLVALDILEVRHGTGTFVGDMSLRPLVESVLFRSILDPGQGLQSLHDVVEVRMGLDIALAPRMVRELAGQPVPELRAAVNAMAESAKRSETFLAHDRAFHLELAGRLHNGLYSELVAAFWDIHKTMSPMLGVASRRDLADTANAHAAMLDAAVAGDLERYRAAVADHYAPLLRVLDHAGEHPQAS